MARNGATGPSDVLAQRFGAFGSGSCLAFPTGAIFGERWIHIGIDTLVGPNVSITAGMVPGQKMVSDPVVRIEQLADVARDALARMLRVVTGRYDALFDCAMP